MEPVETLVEVYRDTFMLRMWRQNSAGNYVKFDYPIAVGKAGDATPHGLYYVDAKNETPDWLIPEHEDYDPELWHKVMPFASPNNPFAGGFISLGGRPNTWGIGIHGTKFDPRVGERASHGCIRMRVDDIERIWDRIPLGCPVVVH